MASGNCVVVSPQPRGTYLEGFISGSLKPGTHLQIQASTAAVGGKFTYEVYAPGTGDGTPRPVLVLDMRTELGQTADTATVSGELYRIYAPVNGDELNVRKADISGTGSATEDLNIGERMLIVDGTGMVSPIAVGVANAAAVYPYTSLEAVTDQAAEQLVWCRFSPY